jgi:hypothetical protein
MSYEVQRYPEWRQLKERIQKLVPLKSKFSYDELEQLSGVDVRTARGRAQFYRFRREALKEWQIWFENIPAFGYAVIPAGQQPHAAVKRVKQAKRKVSMAKAINALAHAEDMTHEQRLLQAQTAALLHDLSQTFNRVGRQFAAAASKLHLEVTKEEVKLIGDRAIPPVKS